MKLAIVTRFPHDPSSPRGGVEAVSINLVRWLAQQPDVTVDVVTEDRAVQQLRVEDWHCATIHRLPRDGASELGNALGAGGRRVREYVAGLQPDIVHAHDTYGMMMRGLDLPRVFTVHGFIHGDTLVGGGRFAWARSIVWKYFETRGWADQPHIISISPYVRERLGGIATGVIHDIDNPISERFFGIRRTPEPATIFCAAAICRRKNQIRLVEALAQLASAGIEARLRLAGPISEPDYRDALDKAARSLGVDSRVALLGQIGVERIESELSTCTAFALVSLEENSPMGIEEAMAAGVPVITSNRCGMPYLVRDGASGFLVDPHSPRDISAAIGRLVRSPELQSRMATKGVEIALDRFHPRAVCESTLEVYRRCIAGRGDATARGRSQ
jgi:glycosyltransferase involved in cell wall biosynthesis